MSIEVSVKCLAMHLPITDGMNKSEHNESDQWQKVDLLCQIVVAIISSQIVTADHQMRGQVAE